MVASSRLYDVIGVVPDASDDDIRKAFKRKALLLHPDKQHGEGSDEQFKELNEAYSVLSDPERRAAYDRDGDGPPPSHHHQQQQHHPHFPGGFPGGGGVPFPGGAGFPFGFSPHQQHFPQQNQQEQQQVDRVTVPISLEDAFCGGSKNIMLTEPRSCAACRGTGAKDPDADVHQCPACGGQGVTVGRLGPFVVHTGECGACRGRGVSPPQPGRECGACDGKGATPQAVPFTFQVPKGMRDGHTTAFAGGGGFDAKRRRHSDLELRASLQLPPRLPSQSFVVTAVDGVSGRISATLRVSLADVLGGFERELGAPWGRRLRARCPGYFCPDVTSPLKFPGLGMPPMGDLAVTIEVVYPADAPLGEAELAAASEASTRGAVECVTVEYIIA
jgi:DnaJ-class molecular chaperone